MTELSPLVAPMPLRLWRVSLDREPSAEELGCLSREELERAGRFVFERDRRRYLAAHCALREILGLSLHCPPGALRFETGPQGKPALVAPPRGCSFNLSHSEDLALVAVARHGELGVDVELLREIPDLQPLAERHFTARELRELHRAPPGRARQLAFLHGWTRKEACLKALGAGLSLETSGFETGLAPETRVVRLRDLDGQRVNLHLQSFVDAGGVVGAVARIAGVRLPAVAGWTERRTA